MRFNKPVWTQRLQRQHQSIHILIITNNIAEGGNFQSHIHIEDQWQIEMLCCEFFSARLISCNFYRRRTIITMINGRVIIAYEVIQATIVAIINEQPAQSMFRYPKISSCLAT